MFENAILTAAIINVMRHNEETADRRAFYGPDAPAVAEQPRRKSRVARFLRRASDVA